jgi:mevalonate kinase
LNPSHSFPAKLLLFGEYTVLSGSQALAVPLSRWSGRWEKGIASSASPLIQYATWLGQEGFISEGQFEIIKTDVLQGWQFDADIPVGYGVGSSGAFVAAWFDKYISHAVQGLRESASVMARMESFFHGTSSGMDPLVSFTRQAIVKDDEGQFHAVQDPGWPEGWRIFLLDSGLQRNTGALVSGYRSMVQDEDFRRNVERSLIPMVDHAIHLYLSGTSAMLEECVSMISQFQRIHFTPMIPDSVAHAWDELSASPGVYVKLCGAGGGGFYLVLSAQDADLSGFNLIAV